MENRKYATLCILIIIAISSVLPCTSFAAPVTFIKEYTYNASDIDSKVSCRAISLEQVKRALLEQLGTYLISETEVKNYQMTKDLITTLTAGIVNAEIIDEKWDGRNYYLKARISADADEVAKSLNILRNDKQKSQELEDAKNRAEGAMREVDRLKKELASVKASVKKQADYDAAITDLGTADWFAFDWSFFTTKNPSEEEVVSLLGKPTKAGTIYDQVDYETFSKINKLDIYMLEYNKPANNHNKIFQSPLGIDASYFMVWFAKPGSYLNKEGKSTRIFSIDFWFSGEDKDRAFIAFKFDKKCKNENNACFFIQQCWQVTISPSKYDKKFDDIFAQKYENGADYSFACSQATHMGTNCLDDEVRLAMNIHTAPYSPSEIQSFMKECESEDQKKKPPRKTRTSSPIKQPKE